MLNKIYETIKKLEKEADRILDTPDELFAFTTSEWTDINSRIETIKNRFMGVVSNLDGKEDYVLSLDTSIIKEVIELTKEDAPTIAKLAEKLLNIVTSDVIELKNFSMDNYSLDLKKEVIAYLDMVAIKQELINSIAETMSILISKRGLVDRNKEKNLNEARNSSIERLNVLTDLYKRSCSYNKQCCFYEGEFTSYEKSFINKIFNDFVNIKSF